MGSLLVSQDHVAQVLLATLRVKGAHLETVALKKDTAVIMKPTVVMGKYNPFSFFVFK
jgi:hypothetical protein